MQSHTVERILLVAKFCYSSLMLDYVIWLLRGSDGLPHVLTLHPQFPRRFPSVKDLSIGLFNKFVRPGLYFLQDPSLLILDLEGKGQKWFPLIRHVVVFAESSVLLEVDFPNSPRMIGEDRQGVIVFQGILQFFLSQSNWSCHGKGRG